MSIRTADAPARTAHGSRRWRWTALATLGLALPLAGCTNGTSGDSASSASSTASSGATSSGAASSSAASASVPAGAQAIQTAYQQVIDRVLPSVVEITTSVGLGSGIVLDDKGDIVTNDHVVGSATTFQVTYAGSPTPHDATLVGTYPPDDLAVIRVTQPAPVQAAQFADSTTVQVGTLVLAMGNPLGLSSSVTDGIVSAVGRTVSEPQSADSPGATLPDVIQTSASINPGNSGGALVNLKGEVVGIPTLAAVDQQLGGGAAPGIGFAIPSNVVTDIAGQLVKSGRVTDSHRAAIGAQVTSLTGQNGKPAGVGVVAVTPGGPAEAAGIQPGDVLTDVAGHPVPDTQQLAAVLAGLSVGQQVPVTVLRNGSQQKLTVALGELPGS